jgi:hypothetical protein
MLRARCGGTRRAAGAHLPVVGVAAEPGEQRGILGALMRAPMIFGRAMSERQS